jgi:hypothetical protein
MNIPILQKSANAEGTSRQEKQVYIPDDGQKAAETCTTM